MFTLKTFCLLAICLPMLVSGATVDVIATQTFTAVSAGSCTACEIGAAKCVEGPITMQILDQCYLEGAAGSRKTTYSAATDTFTQITYSDAACATSFDGSTIQLSNNNCNALTKVYYVKGMCDDSVAVATGLFTKQTPLITIDSAQNCMTGTVGTAHMPTEVCTLQKKFLCDSDTNIIVTSYTAAACTGTESVAAAAADSGCVTAYTPNCDAAVAANLGGIFCKPFTRALLTPGVSPASCTSAGSIAALAPMAIVASALVHVLRMW
jgi:hypothetical protein